MEMRFHGSPLSWAIKHHFISLCCKYQSPGFIRFPTMHAPVISSLDKIYCMLSHIWETFSFSSSFSSSFPSFSFSVPLPPTLKPKYQSPAQISALGLISKPQGFNPSVVAQIPASRFQIQPPGSNLTLKAPILASRLQSQTRDSSPRLKAPIPDWKLQSQP